MNLEYSGRLLRPLGKLTGCISGFSIRAKIFFKYVTFQSSALKLFAIIGNNYCVFESRGLSSIGCWRFLSFSSHIYGCRWPSFLPFLYSSSIHPSNWQFFFLYFQGIYLTFIPSLFPFLPPLFFSSRNLNRSLISTLHFPACPWFCRM